jgi:hypothetical protein
MIFYKAVDKPFLYLVISHKDDIISLSWSRLMLTEFTIHKAADMAHKVGLDLEKIGDFPAAHQNFGHAHDLLDIGLVDYPNDPSLSLQLARVKRDDGFTSAREALQKDRPQKLAEALRTLRISAEHSGKLADQGHQEFSPSAWAYLQAEHGATLAALFRIAVIDEVVFKGMVDTTTPDYYRDDPWRLLTRGSNWYYLASHAMNVARWERMRGRPLAMGRWIVRAAGSVIGAALYDRANEKPALETFSSRLPYLFASQATVQAKARKKP